MIGWILGGILAIVLIYGVVTFNRLVGLGRRADGAWSDIDVQLKRRWDLVPSLVETVKGYARHESSTLQEVVEARSQATHSADIPERAANERSLSTAVSRLFAIAESYPDLKANESFQSLHHSLIEIEDAVQYARRYYNAVVRDLNTLIQGFPSLLVARTAGFSERPFFEIDDPERQTPQISLGDASPPADQDAPRPNDLT